MMKRMLHKGLSILLAAVMLMTVFTAVPVTVNADTHEHPLTHVEKEFPTTEKNGHIECWYCESCGKYFSDESAQSELTEAETLIPYFTYELADGVVKLTGYNGADEDIVIPDTVPENYPDPSLRGKTISVIKESAFEGNQTIKRVKVSDSINNIADYAFDSCPELTEVIIGRGVNYLGMSSFGRRDVLAGAAGAEVEGRRTTDSILGLVSCAKETGKGVFHEKITLSW